MNEHIELPAQANISTAPAMLNMNDKAMWVIGWNECLAAIAAHEQARVVGEPVAFALQFSGEQRLCLSTVFDTREEADRYANACTQPCPTVVPLCTCLAAPYAPQEAQADLSEPVPWGLSAETEHFKKHIDTYADKHPTKLVRQLAARLRLAWASPVAQPATEQAEAPNPLADYHREQYEHAFNGWEACKQECDRLRDELEEATQPTASNAGEHTIALESYLFVTNLYSEASQKIVDLEAALAALSATTPAPAGQDKEALQVVAYGAFKRPGVYRACHDFQALLHDVPSGAHVEELVRKKDADDAIRAARARGEKGGAV